MNGIADTSDAGRWRAVLTRDARLDGSFVYGVTSTGVYCRPSCPSRRPNRSRVVFFGGPEGAEAARRKGFRACRRCRPDAPPADDATLRKVALACRIIDEHPEGSPALRELGDEVGLSPHHLQRTFKRIVGVTPRQYGDERRFGRLKQQLRSKGGTVTHAQYEAGFGSSSRLYEKAPARLGMTPGAYRDGGRGAQIRYTVTVCPLGRLLVAATQKGICRIMLGDDDAGMQAELRSEYPTSQVSRDDAGLRTWTSRIDKHLAGRLPDLDLPLDVRATAFQRQVWELLQTIPRGATLSYAEIARSLGRPGAARAVGQACASNPVALAIPCHRAVRTDGKLGGYRWGTKRKEALLRTERRIGQTR